MVYINWSGLVWSGLFSKT
uniref:Uncharacterized protein n=1 Tax=Rhizophora mucronata TaxID=61149 RepID=A0A2P2NDV7_RHIMU